MTNTNDTVLLAARTHLRARRWREAEALAERWLTRQPDSGEACAVRGLVGLANGQKETAKELIEAAVSLEPQSAFAYLALAHLYCSQNKAEEAEPCLRRALALAPSETEASCLLATLRLAQADVSGAEDLLRGALVLEPSSVLARLSLAELLLRLGRLAEAEPMIAAGLALDQASVPGWMLRAQLLTLQGRWSEACKCCEMALLLEPENPLFLVELARILVLEGSQSGARPAALSEAERAARQAMVLMPKEIAGHLMLGATLRAQGRTEECLAVQAEMVRMAPQDPLPAMELALTLRDARNLDAALLAAKRAAALAPDLLQAQLVWGDILLLKGELAEAFAVLDHLDALARPGQPRLRSPLTPKDIADRDLVLTAPVMLQAVLYARYVPVLEGMGARVSIAVDSQAHGLLARVPGMNKLLTVGASVHGALVEPITRLPALLGADVPSVPWSGAYCLADAGKVAQLSALFSQWPGRRVGLDLGPDPDPALASAVAAVFREASFSVVALSPLETVAQAFEGVSIELSALNDLEQLCTMAQALDCVVTVESLTAHVAGAAGVPCHLLLSLQHDALWGSVSECTPWYPSMRLYREHRQEGWRSVVGALAAALSPDLAVEPG